jgi:hypothetical protein
MRSDVLVVGMGPAGAAVARARGGVGARPAPSYPPLCDIPMVLNPAKIRGFLRQRCRLREVARYQGPCDDEGLLEVLPRHQPGKPHCGPVPHFRLRGDRCLPSCGVLHSKSGLALAEGGRCAQGCHLGVAHSSPRHATWDCEYRCGSTQLGQWPGLSPEQAP